MNQKERILALVKEGTLSMEEALELLEHLDEEPKENEHTAPDETKSQQEAVDKEKLQEQIEELTKEKEMLLKEQTISKQRQRELEVLKEFDDLTPELEKDLHRYQTQQIDLQEQIDRLDAQLRQLKGHTSFQWEAIAQDIKQTVQEATDKVTLEGEKLFNQRGDMKERLTDMVKGALNHYKIRSMGKYLGIQWSKATSVHQTYEFDATHLTQVALWMAEGEWIVRTHPKSTVYIEGQWALYGDPAELNDEVVAWHKVDVNDQGVLNLSTHSGQVAFKGTMYVPETLLEEIRVHIEKGHITFNDVHLNRLKIEGKMLDCQLHHLKVQQFYLDLINGKLDVDQSSIDMSQLSLIKGDVRYKGVVKHITSTLVNGNYYVTKEDETSSELNLTSVKGQMKIAIPETVGIQGRVKQISGNVLHRLLNGIIQQNESSKVTTIMRQVPKEEATVTLEASFTLGDLYLKDYHSN